MAGMDVNDVLTDPLLSTTFDVKRRQAGTDNMGRTQIAEDVFPEVVGVITWEDGPIMRREDGTLVPQAIRISTPFSLRDNSFGFAADIIVWEGTEYLITSTKPWRHLGRGFTKARAESIRATDLPADEGSTA